MFDKAESVEHKVVIVVEMRKQPNKINLNLCNKYLLGKDLHDVIQFQPPFNLHFLCLHILINLLAYPSLYIYSSQKWCQRLK